MSKLTLPGVRDLLRFSRGYTVATQDGVVDDFFYSKLVNATNLVAVWLSYSGDDDLEATIQWTEFQFGSTGGHALTKRTSKVDTIDELAEVLDEFERKAEEHA
jgi:hypothetical protein